MDTKPVLPALDPRTVPARKSTGYPTEAFRAMVAGRGKQALGDALGLANFGVNLVRLEPGAYSSLRHWHTRQDEFVWILEGEITLITDQGEQVLGPGMCAGFAAGVANGHHLTNRTSRPAVYLEVGDRLPGDGANYPDPNVDLQVRSTRSGYQYQHKDGRPYE
ncbi:MAG TPA: cupin domain-containing protein [Candidatus Eisenbacteria bacterium]|nr:cupin domain-containing protein [Candidatus Eisenbacteria bacterium]